MDLQLPWTLSVAFLLTTLATVILLHRAVSSANEPSVKRLAWPITGIALLWLSVQSVISLKGVYWNSPDALPPRIFLLGVLPMLVVIAITFATSAGRRFVDALPLYKITWVHTVRIAVELVLWELSLHGAVPALMTFEGRNLDIVAGLTAPIVAFGILMNWFTPRVVLLWNLICTGFIIQYCNDRRFVGAFSASAFCIRPAQPRRAHFSV